MKRKKQVFTPPLDAQKAAVERLVHLLAPDELARLLAELERPLAQAVRINTLKIPEPGREVQRLAARYDWDVKPVPFCSTGWQVMRASTPPGQAFEQRMGDFYIQDAASMLPVEMFDFSGAEEPLVLDMAASPGGKTTHLICKTSDRGLTLANDPSHDRATSLRLVLQTWGAASAAVTRFAGERLGGWFPNIFDYVLLDAPCSMQNLRSSTSHPMRSITPGEQHGLARRQGNLLFSAFYAARPGGQVVYSTCTLAPEEDEAVVQNLVDRFGSGLRVDDMHTRLPQAARGLSSDGDRTFDPAVQGAVRLWPHCYGTSGFFAARFTKLIATSGEETPPPQRPPSTAGLERLNTRQAAGLVAQFSSQFGINVQGWLDEKGLELWQHGKFVLAVPQAYLRLFAGLPVQALGLAMAEKVPTGHIPTHEWVARMGRGFTAGRLVLPADQVPAWLRGENPPGSWTEQVSPGSVVAVMDADGRLLGRGKVLADRLKNLLPIRLVL